MLSTQFGVHAAQLIRDEIYGVTVALDGNERLFTTRLKDIAGVPQARARRMTMCSPTARNMGICMGDLIPSPFAHLLRTSSMPTADVRLFMGQPLLSLSKQGTILAEYTERQVSRDGRL